MAILYRTAAALSIVPAWRYPWIAQMFRISATLLLALASVVAAQWPQWRGPTRDGVSPESSQTTGWPSQLTRLWERDAGEGYSGPIVEGGRIWIHTRRGNDEFVACHRLATGDQLWQTNYPAPFEQDHDAAMHGRGPFSTPSHSAGRLFTVSVDGILSARDAATGRLLWQRGPSPEFHSAYPYFGAAASPLIWRGFVFYHLGGHRRGGMETPAAGAVVALRVADGVEQWRWPGDGPAIGASPVLCEVERTSHLVFKTKKNIVGLDPATGRQLWLIPYQVTQDNTIVTPVCANGLLISSDYDSGFFAWRIERRAGSWSPRLAWRHRDVSLFMNSPVLAAGLLAGFSHFRRGELFLLNPQHGEVVWRGAPRAGEHATLISQGNQVHAFLQDGSLLVSMVSRQALRPLRRYRLGSQTAWAHPALAGDLIVYKDGTRLCVSKAAH